MTSDTYVYGTSFPGIFGKIKRRYADFIVEEIQLNGKICNVDTFLDGKRSDSIFSVPENIEKKEYLHLDLEKLNMESTLAFKTIARGLQVSEKRIGYAGLKDKRAITCQRISLWKPTVEFIQKFRVPRLALKNPEWSNERIELGSLQGNRFTITVRDIEESEMELNKRLPECIQELEKGVPNYFGMQRFGGIRAVTHIVGKFIVQEDLENAVLTYLGYDSEQEDPETREARKIVREERDYKKALKIFPSERRMEKAMLNHLVKYPRDYAGALQRLPRKIRYLLTHAYQSHLFNRFLEERIREGIGLDNTGKELENTDALVLGLIPGYSSEFTPGKMGEIEQEIMQNEGIELKDFHVTKIPECSCQGNRKEIKLIPKNMKIVEIKGDEFFPGKQACVLKFELNKGNYATTIMRELIKQELD